MPRRREPEDVVIVGADKHPLRDLYLYLLDARWPSVLSAIAGMFLVANALFGVAYVFVGGIANARPGSFRDAFFFSVQTMGTIGYGSMYPSSDAANVLVVIENVVGLIAAALATGIVFARFSRTTGEIVFSRRSCISPMNGVPTLTFRIGNDRSNTIYEARVAVTLVRTEKTTEGQTLYRMYDLTLVREQSRVLQRSFTVMHVITESSPLYGLTPESFRAQEAELGVVVAGTDDTSLQPVHARYRYKPDDIQWGARLDDILSEREDGMVVLDVRKFHDTVATKRTETFPYP